MGNIINDYIHEYDLDYTDFFHSHIGEIEKEYEAQANFARKIYNSPNGPLTDIWIENPKIKSFIIPKLHKIVNENYYAGKQLGEMGLRVYKQTHDNFFEDLHSHSHVMHSIAAVFYLNIPKKGGEILFSYMGGWNNGFEIKIKPKPNKVYFFPSWLPHTPLQHQDKDITRFSFNWGYISSSKSRHKVKGVIW